MKGGDYTPETLDPDEVGALKKVGAEIRTLALVPGKSTSAIIDADEVVNACRQVALGILGSGKGSNCRAILEQIQAAKLPANCRIVVSDVRLTRAS